MRRLTAGVSVLAAIVVALAVAQVVLPGLAAGRLRDRLARSGQVLSVDVSAFPAIELLWSAADRVTVRLGRYQSSPGGLARLLDDSGSVDRVSASARELDTGLLTLRDATLVKAGPLVTGSARVTLADLRTAFPLLESVTPVASPSGTLTLRGTATLFGVTASVDATVQAQGGGVVVNPDVPFGALATVRVFSDPRLRVRSVSGAPAPGGFTVQATGALGG